MNFVIRFFFLLAFTLGEYLCTGIFYGRIESNPLICTSVARLFPFDISRATLKCRRVRLSSVNRVAALDGRDTIFRGTVLAVGEGRLKKTSLTVRPAHALRSRHGGRARTAVHYYGAGRDGRHRRRRPLYRRRHTILSSPLASYIVIIVFINIYNTRFLTRRDLFFFT